MKSIKYVITLFKRFVRQHLYLSIIIAVVIVGISGGAIVLAARDDSSKAQPTVAITNGKAKAVTTAGTANSGTSIEADKKTDTGTAAQSTTTAKAGTAAATKPTAPESQKLLTVMPAAGSVKAGESIAITVRTNDGKQVNRPFITSGPSGIRNNLEAAPLKSVWNGQLSTYKHLTPGSYTLKFEAQLDRTTWYTGYMTLTVTPVPVMTISVQQVGYDAVDDVMLFTVKANRQNGYSQDIQSIYGYDFAGTLVCVSGQIDRDTFALECYHAQGTRPTSGSLQVNATVPPNYDVPPVSTNFNLPPKP